ncbi:hypothetical protein SHIRM173S_05626 [Streptomyces hirsutus]
MVTHEEIGRGRQQATSRSALARSRRLWGFALATTGLPLLCLILASLRGQLSLTSEILVFLMAIMGIALVGGLYPALVGALAGFLLLNYYFTPPIHSFTILETDHLLALVAFILAAAVVSTIVDLAARRTRDAARASADAEVLSTLAGNVLRGEHAVDTLLERLRETFGMTSVALLELRHGAPLTPERRRDPHSWQVVASVGAEPCTCPDEGDTDIPVGDELALVLLGRPLLAADRRILEAFAAQAASAFRQQRLEEEAQQIRPLFETERMHTAVINAVSHELRSALAAAKDAVDGLDAHDGERNGDEGADDVAVAKESFQRLDQWSPAFLT